MSNLVVEVTEGGFDLHDEDEFFTGTVSDIEYQDGSQSMFGNAQFKWYLRLDADNVDVPEGDENERHVWYYTTAKLTTDDRNKLRKAVKGLTGQAPDPGDKLDLGQFIGQRIKVMFEHYEGKDKDGKPVTKDKIVMLKAA